MKQQKMNGRNVFVDMDGVIADFDGRLDELGCTAEQAKKHQGFLLGLKVIEGAREGMDLIHRCGFQVWIATKPMTGNARSYYEKALWVFEYFPEYQRRLIMTAHKELLGTAMDFLIDDNPERYPDFPGQIIHFGKAYQNWSEVCDFFQFVTELKR
jgi:5'(3')-deoxyribonucleotidase